MEKSRLTDEDTEDAGIILRRVQLKWINHVALLTAYVLLSIVHVFYIYVMLSVEAENAFILRLRFCMSELRIVFKNKTREICSQLTQVSYVCNRTCVLATV